MTKRLYLLIVASALMCGLLLAAVLVPMGSNAAVESSLLTREPAPTPPGMAWVPGGTFTMGTDAYLSPGDPNPDRIKADETPAHEVELDGFWMDTTPVTNRQFREFVDQTGYVTFAERKLTKADFQQRGADTTDFPADVINPGSMCFNPKFDRKQLVMQGPGWEHQVWMIVDGADWRHPDGPESSIDDKLDHPVVHIAWEDAQAYCQWAGKRLPTEAEFEYAAKGGGKPLKYPWGNELTPGDKFMANYWQGEFPLVRENQDGFLTTSPVKSFPPNSLGLYDMAGNVWEWCQDLYDADYYSVSPRKNPQGPSSSFDPQMPGTVKRVQRGGSFLCNFNNCTGYRTCSRGRGDIASSSYHNGFRCVVDAKMLPAFKTAQQRIAAARK
jgi:formylglycine-generating enzyme required for sulfatase activity